MTTAIVLLILSLAFVVMEIFIPSMGLLTVLALGCLAGSLILGFGESLALGISLAGVAVLGLPVAIYLAYKVFPHTSIGRRMILTGGGVEPVREPGSSLLGFLGHQGITRSALRPSGVAEIDGRRVDVITRGELVDPGIRIEVIEVKGNRVLVRPLESAAEAEAEEEVF